jgi:release factor glutamine methyltransferase
MSENAWTIARVLDWTRGFFESKGIDTARLDAELLIAHALGLERIALYMDHHRPLSTKELEAIRALVRRRSKLEPIHYILGQRDFWSITLTVDPRVLIPRPDTEKLVELALAHVNADTAQILDLCTGSGAIALAIASEHPNLRLTATDISPEAITLAQKNCADLNLSNVQFQVSNLFEGLSGTFTMIVSNPPYISSSACKDLMPDVRDYEPMLALDGGSDGLEYYRNIIEQSPQFLAKDGHLFLEIGYDQADAVKDIIDKRLGVKWIGCHQDLAGNDRVVHAQRT